MTLAPHRKMANRDRELRERAWAVVTRDLTGHICARCGATFKTHDDKCQADVGDACEGNTRIEAAYQKAAHQLGITS